MKKSVPLRRPVRAGSIFCEGTHDRRCGARLHYRACSGGLNYQQNGDAAPAMETPCPRTHCL